MAQAHCTRRQGSIVLLECRDGYCGKLSERKTCRRTGGEESAVLRRWGHVKGLSGEEGIARRLSALFNSQEVSMA